MIKHMIELRRQATRAGWRITAWKCTKRQAADACDEIATDFGLYHLTRPEILLGARIIITDG